MKIALCLLLLSAAVAVQSAVVNTSTRANLNVGAINAGDRLLTRRYLYRLPIINTIQTEEFTYRGNPGTRISAIQANENGYTQYGNIWIVSGGLNQDNVTLRAQSQRGRGFYYVINIWGQ